MPASDILPRIPATHLIVGCDDTVGLSVSLALPRLGLLKAILLIAS